MPPGTLYLVGTPIGNLQDLSPRAREVLSRVSVIAAEDTRHTRRLLSAFDLHVPLESYHAHNLRAKGEALAARMQAGEDVALVSDAGMPCVSDPGAELVALCADRGIPVVVVPGPSAFVAGLAGSALDTSRFVFEGFLPASGALRRRSLAGVAAEGRTVVLYESPHRLRRTLADLAKAGLGSRRISLCREITKLHEEFLRTTVDGAVALHVEREPRGEYCLVLEGADAAAVRTAAEAALPGDGADRASGDPPGTQADLLAERLAVLLADGLSVKDAAAAAAASLGLPKKQAYAAALGLRAGKPSRLL